MGAEHEQSDDDTNTTPTHDDFQTSLTQPTLPNPNETGRLSDDELNTLWAIVSVIGDIWQIADHSAMSQLQFNTFMKLKTLQSPSYYTVYTMALRIYDALHPTYGDETAHLFFQTATPDKVDAAEWAVVRQYVSKEFLAIYVTQGAFKAYGWQNYPGFNGGPYNDPTNSPYRVYR